MKKRLTTTRFTATIRRLGRPAIINLAATAVLAALTPGRPQARGAELSAQRGDSPARCR